MSTPLYVLIGGRSVGIVRSRAQTMELYGLMLGAQLLKNRKVSSGARGSVVVKALCYKPYGRGFETR
jgi:hypothetical protein